MDRFKIIVHFKNKGSETLRNQTEDQLKRYRKDWAAKRNDIEALTWEIEPKLRIIK